MLQALSFSLRSHKGLHWRNLFPIYGEEADFNAMPCSQAPSTLEIAPTTVPQKCRDISWIALEALVATIYIFIGYITMS